MSKPESGDLTSIGELSKDFNQNEPSASVATNDIPGLSEAAQPIEQPTSNEPDWNPDDPLQITPPESPVPSPTTGSEQHTYEPPAQSAGEGTDLQFTNAEHSQATTPTSEIAPDIALEPPTAPSFSSDPLPDVQAFSEQESAKVEVPASYPFTLLIEGTLAPEEKERLLDILSRENLGIREVDLEPQFYSNKLLLPRISEFACVMIVQALRGAKVKMTSGPAEEIFSSESSREETTHSPVGATQRVSAAPSQHPAEALPVTEGDEITGIGNYKTGDLILASATLKTTLLEAEHSDEYHEILEALHRELRYKAFHKGAIGILHYRVQLQSLNLPSHYKILVTGTAVKPQK